MRGVFTPYLLLAMRRATGCQGLPATYWLHVTSRVCKHFTVTSAKWYPATPSKGICCVAMRFCTRSKALHSRGLHTRMGEGECAARVLHVLQQAFATGRLARRAGRHGMAASLARSLLQAGAAAAKAERQFLGRSTGACHRPNAAMRNVHSVHHCW